MPKRVLVVDDEAASRTGLQALLESHGYRVESAASGAEALEKARSFRPAVVIADLVMPGMDGLELVRSLQDEAPFAVTILLTGQGSIETAVQAMKAGVYDYLTKPVDLERLTLLLEKAVDRARIGREVAVLRRQTGSGDRPMLLGRSAAIQAVLQQIEQAATSVAPVLVLGESGTGKELVARTLHALSPRARASFVGVNCAAIAESLLESEIFGHEKGAFTGAIERRIGCFEMADGGTLLLDEVAEMHPAVQAKFLRVLEEGTFRRVGGKAEIQVDVRVVAATNQEPDTAVRDGKLRADLFYRLNVFPIKIPPLRERPDDIPVLAEAFLHDAAARNGRTVTAITPEALQRLQGYAWPGNVRELRNVIERAVLLADGETIDMPHLPEGLGPSEKKSADAVATLTLPLGITIDEAEKTLILQSLKLTGHNKTRAAGILGINVKTLHNKLTRYLASGATDTKGGA
jgi:DNA-binding NtrC family response regulator